MALYKDHVSSLKDEEFAEDISQALERCKIYTAWLDKILQDVILESNAKE